mmetsp:Transcript_20226/g.47895  ORF Transcript_20226/g.47895 Transcript_20226/m.47895 type:complete len:282 (-) Transcript_20226:176-1021(-)
MVEDWPNGRRIVHCRHKSLQPEPRPSFQVNGLQRARAVVIQGHAAEGVALRIAGHPSEGKGASHRRRGLPHHRAILQPEPVHGAAHVREDHGALQEAGGDVDGCRAVWQLVFPKHLAIRPPKKDHFGRTHSKFRSNACRHEEVVAGGGDRVGIAAFGVGHLAGPQQLTLLHGQCQHGAVAAGGVQHPFKEEGVLAAPSRAIVLPPLVALPVEGKDLTVVTASVDVLLMVNAGGLMEVQSRNLVQPGRLLQRPRPQRRRQPRAVVVHSTAGVPGSPLRRLRR